MNTHVWSCELFVFIPHKMVVLKYDILWKKIRKLIKHKWISGKERDRLGSVWVVHKRDRKKNVGMRIAEITWREWICLEASVSLTGKGENRGLQMCGGLRGSVFSHHKNYIITGQYFRSRFYFKCLSIIMHLSCMHYDF